MWHGSIETDAPLSLLPGTYMSHTLQPVLFSQLDKSAEKAEKSDFRAVTLCFMFMFRESEGL